MFVGIQNSKNYSYPAIRNGILILFVTALSQITNYSYAQSITQLVDSYVEQIRSSPNASEPATLSDQKNAVQTIEAALGYFSDTLSHVRAKMYTLVGTVGKNSADQSIRQLITEILCNNASDYENLDGIITQLNTFQAKDFSVSAKDSLAALLHRSPPYLDELIRLIGSLQISDLTSELRALANSFSTKQQVRWAALIALARMGDPESIQSIMRRVQRLPVNDDVVYEVFPDLIYTLQRQAIDYLVVELKSDEKKCYTADAEDETPITCAYRIMEMLAPVIEKYPLQVDASGDIQTKDYKKSLTTVRAWFEKSKNYQIIQ